MQKKKEIVSSIWDEIFYSGKTNFSNHAFPLYLFTTRLYQELTNKGTKDVLFMSREGQFLKTLFDKYLALRGELGLDCSPINTHYFYGSRNSIMTASMGPLETESFDHLFRFFRFFISAKMFLFSIGFNLSQIAQVRSSFGKDLDRICINFRSSNVFKRLKQNEDFRSIYDGIRQTQSNTFWAYVHSFGLNFSDGLVFVDIGYHGTMQDLIFKFFNQTVDTTGYFIKSRAHSVEHNRKIGLLGDANNPKLRGSKITKYDSFNYEQILRADHGRCLGYAFDDKRISQPILDKEFKDKEIFDNLVAPLQDEILTKFERIARCCECANIDDLCIVYFYHLIKNKSPDDYKWLLDMQDCHHDDFGYVGYPGKAFSRWLRKIAFRLKDKTFTFFKAGYVRKLKKSLRRHPFNGK